MSRHSVFHFRIQHILASIVSPGMRKKQLTVARSSTEVEYRAMALTASDIAWIVSLLSNVQVSLKHPPHYFCYLSAVYLTTNPIQCARTKHLKIDYYKVTTGTSLTKYVSARNQLVDLFAKGLPKSVVPFLRSTIIPPFA